MNLIRQQRAGKRGCRVELRQSYLHRRDRSFYPGITLHQLSNTSDDGRGTCKSVFMFRRVVRFDFLSLVPSTRFSTVIHRAIVVVTKLIQSITLHSKYSWLKEVTLERYSSVTLEENLWMSNLKELKMMINRWQTIDWTRGGQNGECQVQLWQNWRTMSLILRAWLNDWVCVWMNQKSGIAHNCTASCWRAQLSTNRGALRTFLPLVIPQWASAHLTVHQRSRFYKLHSGLVTITRQHSVSWKISVTGVVSKR